MKTQIQETSMADVRRGVLATSTEKKVLAFPEVLVVCGVIQALPTQWSGAGSMIGEFSAMPLLR